MSGQALTSGSNSRYIDHDPSTAECWVHWQMEGTQAILGSFRISSISDTGVGKTRLSFDINFATAAYCLVLGAGFDSTHDDDHILNIKENVDTGRVVGHTDIAVSLNTNGGSATDFADVHECSALFFQSQGSEFY